VLDSHVKDPPPPPLAQALSMHGGVNGAVHRKLVDLLNTANISRLCTLKGIGKQRARKLVETRQLHPYGPVLTHVEQLASVVGMTSRQVCCSVLQLYMLQCASVVGMTSRKMRRLYVCRNACVSRVS